MNSRDPRAGRRARLQRAQLYLVFGAEPGPEHLPDLIRAAAAGGVEVFQLRDKQLPDDELTSIANALAALCRRLDVLLIVNDRPWVAIESGADGLHVGQDDMPVARARELMGEDLLLGLSTHRAQEIDAVDAGLVDYIGVGPVHETPTKPGRPAVGAELVRYAAGASPVPFFAIGGLDASNVEEVVAAGAKRICVVRAIAAAADPQAAARGLRERLPPLSGEPR